MFLAQAGHMAAEGDAIFGGPKAVAVNVARDIGAVAAEEIDFIPVRPEGKACAARIEVVFSESYVTAGLDDPTIGNAEFVGIEAVVREEPAADVNRGGCRIVEFDGIHLRQIGVSQRFVDQDGADGQRRRVHVSW